MARNFEQESFPSKTSKSPSRWKQRVAVATTGLTLFGLGAGGASVYYKITESQSPEFSSTSVASPPSVERDPLLPVAPCRSDPKPNSLGKSEDEQACAEAQKHSEVVIVDFGDLSKTPTVASEASTMLATETKQTLTPSISIKKASLEAKKTLLKNITAAGCLKNKTKDNKTEMAANITDRTMPELRAYDFVLAYVPYASCTKEGGLGDYRGRLADVYTINPTTIAHELGHLFGLSHRGKVLRRISDRKKDYSFVNLSLDKKDTINLQQYLRPNRYYYDEADDPSSVMGNYLTFPNNAGKLESNPLQIDFLHKLAGSKTTSAKPIEQAAITITRQEEENGAYGILKLTKPVSLFDTRDEEKKYEKLYDYLAVIPKTIGASKTSPFRSYGLYLTNGSAMTVKIAEGKEGVSYIQTENETLTIDVDNNNLKVQRDTVKRS